MATSAARSSGVSPGHAKTGTINSTSSVSPDLACAGGEIGEKTLLEVRHGVQRMHVNAVGDLGATLSSSARPQRCRPSSRSRGGGCPVRRQQGHLVELAVVVKPLLAIEGSPGRLDRLDIIPHPGRRSIEVSAVAALNVRLDLGTQTKPEATPVLAVISYAIAAESIGLRGNATAIPVVKTGSALPSRRRQSASKEPGWSRCRACR